MRKFIVPMASLTETHNPTAVDNDRRCEQSMLLCLQFHALIRFFWSALPLRQQ